MKKIYLILIAIISINIANAQWIQTNCPIGNHMVTCIAASGNKILVGTEGGGIFASTNMGANWTPITISTADTNIYSISISGTTTLAGTGNKIFKSIDNGITWTNLYTSTDALQITSFLIDGTNIFATTWGGLHDILLSTNNGTTWTTIINGLTTNGGSGSIVKSGTNIFVSSGCAGVNRSSDYGANWASINNGLGTQCISKLALLGTNLFAGTYGVYLSTNNGNNWVAKNNGITNLNDANSFAQSGNNLFTGTQGGVFLTNNNATSWTDITSGFTNDYIIALAVDGTYLYAGTLSPVTWTGKIWKRPLSDFVGINENTLSNNISIYPNPTSSTLTIETNSNTKQNLEIVNLIGQSLYTYNIYSKATVDVSAFPKGVYLIKLNTDKGIFVKKFVKE